MTAATSTPARRSASTWTGPMNPVPMTAARKVFIWSKLRSVMLKGQLPAGSQGDARQGQGNRSRRKGRLGL